MATQERECVGYGRVFRYASALRRGARRATERQYAESRQTRMARGIVNSPKVATKFVALNRTQIS